MPRLRLLTAGESHGPALVVIIDGFPAGLPIDREALDRELKRRQVGYGRSGRMRIEKDRVEILSGLRHGYTLGSPIAVLIENRDWANWKDIMAAFPDSTTDPQKRRITHPRPGHADLAGGLKYGHADLRNVLERASARETAVRVAAGALAKQLLQPFGIQIRGHIRSLGPVHLDPDRPVTWEEIAGLDPLDPLPCVDAELRKAMYRAIDEARTDGETLGGEVEIVAVGVPPGLGSYAQWDQRLDARIAGAMMSLPAVKGVFIGGGPQLVSRPGSQVHDEIVYQAGHGYSRTTNRAGGIEGGVSNGMPIVVRLYKKPIPTLKKRLQTVDIVTRQPHPAAFERSDITAVVPLVVIAEAMLAWVLGDVLLAKFGGDHIRDTLQACRAYQKRLSTYPDWPEDYPDLPGSLR